MAPVPPFSVSVTLSPSAEQQLANDGETIRVAAYFYGFPASAYRWRADEMGEIHLGKDEREMGRAGSVHFASSTYDAAKSEWLDEQGPQILINVVSGRRVSTDNVLECSIFEGGFGEAASKAIHIRCGLIGEFW